MLSWTFSNVPATTTHLLRRAHSHHWLPQILSPMLREQKRTMVKEGWGNICVLHWKLKLGNVWIHPFPHSDSSAKWVHVFLPCIHFSLLSWISCPRLELCLSTLAYRNSFVTSSRVSWIRDRYSRTSRWSSEVQLKSTFILDCSLFLYPLLPSGFLFSSSLKKKSVDIHSSQYCCRHKWWETHSSCFPSQSSSPITTNGTPGLWDYVYTAPWKWHHGIT